MSCVGRRVSDLSFSRRIPTLLFFFSSQLRVKKREHTRTNKFMRKKVKL